MQFCPSHNSVNSVPVCTLTVLVCPTPTPLPTHTYIAMQAAPGKHVYWSFNDPFPIMCCQYRHMSKTNSFHGRLAKWYCKLGTRWGKFVLLIIVIDLDLEHFKNVWTIIVVHCGFLSENINDCCAFMGFSQDELSMYINVPSTY